MLVQVFVRKLNRDVLVGMVRFDSIGEAIPGRIGMMEQWKKSKCRFVVTAIRK